MGTLIDYLEALGVRVIHQAPEAGARWAEWCSRSKTVRIRSDLGPPQYSYALAHEAGHAFHGHSCSWSRWEWEADVFAATWLIHSADWELAVKVHETVQGVAHELGVIPHLVRVYHSI